MEKTRGQKFYEQHRKYLAAHDIDGLIDDQYTEDAVLISPFDVLEDEPPPHVVRGARALKEFFKKYAAWQGSINVEKLYNFAETEDSIMFQSVFTSRTGRWVTGNAWHLRDGKIDVHYGFAYKIG